LFILRGCGSGRLLSNDGSAVGDLNTNGFVGVDILGKEAGKGVL
jgi:hypothetical protein